MKNTCLFIWILLIAVACGEQTLPEYELYEVRKLGKLSTIEYTVGKIIKLDDSNYELSDIEWKEWTELPQYGERKILISCRAKIKAGVDLSKIKDGDITVTGSTIEIKLPPAEITSFSMDPASIRTEMENTSGTRSAFTEKEKTSFLKQGEDAIKEDINQTGILENANDNAEAFLIDFYKQLGFEHVVVVHSNPSDE